VKQAISHEPGPTSLDSQAEGGSVSEIELAKLTKVYPDGTPAVSALDLEIGDGEFVVFVGPSGCGKTTALRMIAGLEQITDGTVRIGDEVVNSLPPKDRDVAMVFQNYALYPHMSAFDNMGFALKMRGVPKSEIDLRVRNAARVLGLTEVLKKKPRTLSGGQRQRVAMGRAIVRQPQAFLMDEPLSNLDAKLRVEMRAEISRIQRDLQVTTIYVTHDQVEAMTMGDRVAVLRGGHLQQVASPQELYDRPANLFVAEFIGSPAMNLVQADLVRADAGVQVRFAGASLTVPDSVLSARPGLAAFEGRKVVAGIRPEDLEDSAFARDGGLDVLPVEVDIREDMGAEVFAHFSIDAEPVETAEVLEAMEEEDVPGAVRERLRQGVPFIARLERGTQAREGERLDLVVDTRRLHFFDPETGLGIYEQVTT
jgi:multiple sugar transport system ATP-binding protein